MRVEKAYPPSVAILREQMLSAIADHWELVNRECERRSPDAIRARIRASEQELSWLHHLLVVCERRATFSLLMSKDEARKLNIPGVR